MKPTPPRPFGSHSAAHMSASVSLSQPPCAMRHQPCAISHVRHVPYTMRRAPCAIQPGRCPRLAITWGMMYSMVVQFWSSSAGRFCSLMCSALAMREARFRLASLHGHLAASLPRCLNASAAFFPAAWLQGCLATWLPGRLVAWRPGQHSCAAA